MFLEIQGFLRNRGRLHRWCHRWYFIHHLCLGQNLRVQEAHLGRRKPQRRTRAFGPRTPCRDTESVREERENGADVADRILISSSTSLSQKCTSYVCVCVCMCVCVCVCACVCTSNSLKCVLKLSFPVTLTDTVLKDSNHISQFLLLR